MFRRRSQSWTPLNGGDLASPSNHIDNDNLQLEDGTLQHHSQAPPTYDDIANGDYELVALSG